ncbi:MAG: TonB-dependent receptor plug domain-containing protein, partial [Sediminibacterium sp.]
MVPPPIKIKVLDSTGAPLSGATVALKNKIFGVTDAEGMFTLNANAGDIINVSFVGYRSRQVSITSSILSSPNTLIIALVPVVDMLQDVTVEVNTGYQEINRNHITGSYSVLNNKAFNRTVSSDVLSRMKGMVAGVLFDKNTGDPTGIAVRNRNTINSSTKPLIIVDNFPYNLDLNSLNPNDIESITVLKDAASAAIWGAFSSNGVIIITTKKGKYNQRLRVNVNSNFTVGEKPDLFYDRTFLDSKTMLEVENFLYGKGHYVADINNTFNYPMISPGVEIYDKLSKGLLTSSEADSKLAALSMNDIRRDYNKYFYRQSLTQQYAINLNGGSEKMNYFASLGYDKSYANVVGNESERVTLNSNFTFEPMSFAELNGGIYIANSKSINNGIERIVGGNKYPNTIYPYASLVDNNNNPTTVYKDFNHEFIENLPVKGLLDWHYNPLLDIKYNDKRSNGLENRLFSSLKLSIIKGLSAEFKYQYQKSVTDERTLLGKQSFYVRDLVNRFSKIVQDSVVGYNIPYGDILTSANVYNISNQGRAQINYQNTFDDHVIAALIGVDYTQTKVQADRNTFYNYNTETGSFGLVDYISNYPTYPTLNLSTIPSLGDGISPYKLDRYRSYFFNSNYTYNTKYTLSFSARLDQSNLFGVRTNQKTVPLWSIGGRWDANKENFFKATWIDNFVFRGSFGYRGNVNKSITAFTLVQNQGNESINNLPYSSVIYPGNRDLRWEKVQTLNV